MTGIMDRYRVQPGHEVRLDEQDPDDESAFTAGKKQGEKAASAATRNLEQMQELLYANGRQRLLVVLQAMDTGGKDGTIRRVFDGVNPVGVKVASFKKPTEIDLAHDYLWRVHPHVPGNGEITIFNRSHYEDVLVVRVNGLVPPERWGRRYDHIVAFERMLVEEGTTIVKFFLHISREEQRSRLQERIDDPQKHWKFAPGDLEERKKWADYQHAYEDALSRTSTDFAPWYVVPANRKWYRDLVVGTVLVETLQGLNLTYPEPETDITGLVVE
ncbi:MAG TPA: polyphosphate kinase 2 family protein [Acidimicrobiia bacterium]|nr:polyphosphate kinase 2 family protein [Acidimicrobiia bacterium]